MDILLVETSPTPKILTFHWLISDVRVAALECLVDFVRADGRWNDLQDILDILESDPDPGLRHKLAELIIRNPPFRRAHRERLDIPELVERIWTNIK